MSVPDEQNEDNNFERLNSRVEIPQTLSKLDKSQIEFNVSPSPFE
jgi:hypothetical protein